jgi:hypothetical protein
VRPLAAIKEWVRFYRAVQPAQTKFVLATFEEVTRDFGDVMNRINERFGTSYPLFEHSEDNVARVQQMLDDYGVRKRGYLREESIARPSAARTAANEAARSAMTGQEGRLLLTEADELYDAMVAARTA